MTATHPKFDKNGIPPSWLLVQLLWLLLNADILAKLVLDAVKPVGDDGANMGGRGGVTKLIKPDSPPFLCRP